MSAFKKKYLPLLLCILGSYVTYVHRFPDPPHFFWDENYYLTGAEKYRNGIFFMQTHPPLGKLLIALGDIVLNPNSDIKNDFVDFDHAKQSPPQFSFTGYRLFPVLMGAGGAIVLYFIFLGILSSPWWALSLCTLYLFDNAQIIQSRGAMLDSIFTFFFLLYLFFSLRIFQKRGRIWLNAVLAGIFFGMLVTTKDSGMFFAPFLAIALARAAWPDLKRVAKLWAAAVTPFFVVFVSVWCLHYNLFHSLNPKLRNEGRYDASPESVDLILNSWVAPWDLFTLLPENYAFVKKDHAGIPHLNLCKPDENGAPVWLWPLGVRAINYRWETTDGGKTYSYLNLVANPAIWAVSLATLVLLFSLFLIQSVTSANYRSLFDWPVLSLMGVMLLYLGILNSYDRVFFLYSYFPALNISFILLAYLLREIPKLSFRSELKERLPQFFVALPIAGFAAFIYFAPLTYNVPLSREDFQARAWLKLWNLRCVNCPREGIFIMKE